MNVPYSKKFLLTVLCTVALISPAGQSKAVDFPKDNLSLVIACGLPIFIISGIRDVDRGMYEVHALGPHIRAIRAHLREMRRHMRRSTGNLVSGCCKIGLTAAIMYYLFSSHYNVTPK